MKALTIWQPYAALLITDIKKYETRGWATKYRGPIAIHAAKKPIKEEARMIPEEVQGAINMIVHRSGNKIKFPLGAIVGTAELVDCHRIDEVFIATLPEDEKTMGDFTIGRYAWEFINKSTETQRQDVTGGQGLWNWNRGDR